MAPPSIALLQGPPGLHSPLQCCQWRPSGGCTRSLQHKAAASGEATRRSTGLSDQGRSCPWVPLLPCPTQGSPQGSRGCQRGTSDNRASRFVLGQPLRVAFAVLVQVKAAGIDSRAGGGKANDCYYLSGTTGGREGSEFSTHPQAPAWAPSSPSSGTDCSMTLLCPSPYPADLIWLQNPSVL